MNRILKRWTCVLAAALAAFAMAGAEDVEGLLLAEPLWNGDEAILLQIPEGMTELGFNAYAGEDAIGETAEHDGATLELRLIRPLQTGEAVRAVVTGKDAAGMETTLQGSFSVTEPIGTKTARIEARLETMWREWKENVEPALQAGEVYLPLTWKEIPFAMWPDEMPEIAVRRRGNTVEIAICEELPEGWRVCLGQGLVVQYTDCEYDPTRGIWTGEDQGSTEAVYLIRDAEEERIGISIAYKAREEYRASYPVLEWAKENENDIIAFNCYGWETAREFYGGMYAIVSGMTGVFTEYGEDGVLTQYADPYSGCVYNPQGELIEGEASAEGNGLTVTISH